MWIIYYLNHKRISDVAYQIQPSIVSEEKKTKRKQLGFQGKGKLGLNNLFSKLFTTEAEISGNTDLHSDSEQIIYYPELDQKTKIALDYFKKQKNYIELNEEIKRNIRINPNKLIKFSGMFHPHINANSYPERLAKYESIKNICWTGKCGEIQLKFNTGKNSIISNTPIHPALETKNGKIHLDGFGIFAKQTNNNLTITPLILGTLLTRE